MRKYLLNKLIAHFVAKDFRIIVRMLWKHLRKQYRNVYTLNYSEEMISHELAELVELEYNELRKCNKLMFTRSKYWVHEDGEANVYTIMKRDNWFMTIRVNGELPLSRQLKAISVMVQALNRGNP